jgi:hypothetical protein
MIAAAQGAALPLDQVGQEAQHGPNARSAKQVLVNDRPNWSPAEHRRADAPEPLTTEDAGQHTEP